MSLHAILDSEAFEALPDSIDPRSLFVERDGKYELSGIEGIKTLADVERLQKALESERGEHRGVKTKLSPLVQVLTGALGEGQEANAESLQTLLDELEDARTRLEAGEGKELDEEAIQQLVEKRTAPLLRPLERERDRLTEQLTEATQRIQVFEQREFTRGFQDEVRSATSGEKGINLESESVREDIELRSGMFEVVDGKYVTKDGVGVTPGLSVREWLLDEQQGGRRPHWFVGHKSAGAGGGGGPKANDGKNPFAADSFNFTEIGQMVKNDPERAVRLAVAAKRTDLLPVAMRPKAA